MASSAGTRHINLATIEAWYRGAVTLFEKNAKQITSGKSRKGRSIEGLELKHYNALLHLLTESGERLGDGLAAVHQKVLDITDAISEEDFETIAAVWKLCMLLNCVVMRSHDGQLCTKSMRALSDILEREELSRHDAVKVWPEGLTAAFVRMIYRAFTLRPRSVKSAAIHLLYNAVLLGREPKSAMLELCNAERDLTKIGETLWKTESWLDFAKLAHALLQLMPSTSQPAIMSERLKFFFAEGCRSAEVTDSFIEGVDCLKAKKPIQRWLFRLHLARPAAFDRSVFVVVPINSVRLAGADRLDLIKGVIVVSPLAVSLDCVDTTGERHDLDVPHTHVRRLHHEKRGDVVIEYAQHTDSESLGKLVVKLDNLDDYRELSDAIKARISGVLVRSSLQEDEIEVAPPAEQPQMTVRRNRVTDFARSSTSRGAASQHDSSSRSQDSATRAHKASTSYLVPSTPGALPDADPVSAADDEFPSTISARRVQVGYSKKRKRNIGNEGTSARQAKSAAKTSSSSLSEPAEESSREDTDYELPKAPKSKKRKSGGESRAAKSKARKTPKPRTKTPAPRQARDGPRTISKSAKDMPKRVPPAERANAPQPRTPAVPESPIDEAEARKHKVIEWSADKPVQSPRSLHQTRRGKKASHARPAEQVQARAASPVVLDQDDEVDQYVEFGPAEEAPSSVPSNVAVADSPVVPQLDTPTIEDDIVLVPAENAAARESERSLSLSSEVDHRQASKAAVSPVRNSPVQEPIFEVEQLPERESIKKRVPRGPAAVEPAATVQRTDAAEPDAVLIVPTAAKSTSTAAPIRQPGRDAPPAEDTATGSEPSHGLFANLLNRSSAARRPQVQQAQSAPARSSSTHRTTNDDTAKAKAIAAEVLKELRAELQTAHAAGRQDAAPRDGLQPPDLQREDADLRQVRFRSQSSHVPDPFTVHPDEEPAVNNFTKHLRAVSTATHEKGEKTPAASSSTHSRASGASGRRSNPSSAAPGGTRTTAGSRSSRQVVSDIRRRIGLSATSPAAAAHENTVVRKVEKLARRIRSKELKGKFEAMLLYSISCVVKLDERDKTCKTTSHDLHEEGSAIVLAASQDLVAKRDTALGKMQTTLRDGLKQIEMD